MNPGETHYFVVGIDPISPEQTETFRKWLDRDGVGWWHWVEGLWLITTFEEEMGIEDIRDKICEISPGTTTLVLEVTPATWAGYGPSSGKKNMFSWLKTDWG